MASKSQPTDDNRSQESTRQVSLTPFWLEGPFPPQASPRLVGQRDTKSGGRCPALLNASRPGDSMETQDDCRGIFIIAALAKRVIEPSHEICLVPGVDVLAH